MKVWTEPKVTVVGRTMFEEPVHLPVKWEDDGPADHPERLVEYAGRLCYMSQSNPGRKTTQRYIAHVLEEGHGSVLEHSSVSVLLEGVSRALSHELVRHRAGTAVSQLSQRFVAGGLSVVVPPALCADAAPARLREDWLSRAAAELGLFQQQLAQLQAAGLAGKPLREAARSLLPNCTETKLVFTANLRAWRHIVAVRGAPGADAEFQRLARVLLAVLGTEAPATFQDFGLQGPRWGKV